MSFIKKSCDHFIMADFFIIVCPFNIVKVNLMINGMKNTPRHEKYAMDCIIEYIALTSQKWKSESTGIDFC